MRENEAGLAAGALESKRPERVILYLPVTDQKSITPTSGSFIKQTKVLFYVRYSPHPFADLDGPIPYSGCTVRKKN